MSVMSDSTATTTGERRSFAPRAWQSLQQLAERVVSNRQWLIRDALLVLRHLPTVPWIVLPVASEPGARAEFNPRSYHSIFDALTVLAQVLVPAERRSISDGTIVVQPEHWLHHEENIRTKWFFINGIATSPPMALLEAGEVARMFQRPINLIHTPTFGVLWDLWDSMTARTLRKDGKLSRPAFRIIRQALMSHDRVVLLAYSQGTIVSSYIVRKLLKDSELRPHLHKLEIYLVAGVADSLQVDYSLSAVHGRPVPYVEHFANGLDFFARIGVLAYIHSTSGHVFMIPEKKGHMLNDHYLPGIQRGDYCHGRSRLFKYVHGETPGDDEFMRPAKTA